MDEADSYLGDIIVTYFNFGIFDRRLTKGCLPPVVNLSFSYTWKSNSTKPLLIKVRRWGFLKGKEVSSGLTFTVLIKTSCWDQIWSLRGRLKSASSLFFFFMRKRYWLFHTKTFQACLIVRGIYSVATSDLTKGIQKSSNFAVDSKRKWDEVWGRNTWKEQSTGPS